MLVECGASTESIDAIGLTPLHLAARFGQMETVEALLAKRADPTALDSQQRDPAKWAAIFGKWSVVAVLQQAAGITQQ